LAWAEDPSSHAEDPTTSIPPIAGGQENGGPTRGEVLLKRLTEMQLPSSVVSRLFDETSRAEKLTPEDFGQLVDRIAATPPDTLSDEQKAKLKQVYAEELGAAGITNPGRELNLALGKLRENPQALAQSAKPGALPGLGAPNIPGVIDPARINQFLQSELGQIQAKLDQARQAGEPSKTDKGQGRDRQRGGNALLGTLLQALQGQGKNDQDRDRDERDERRDRRDRGDGPRDFGRGFTHGGERSDDDDPGSRRKTPPSKDNAKNDNQNVGAILAALGNRDGGGGGDKKGGGSDDGKKNDKGGEFKFPERKERRGSDDDKDKDKQADSKSSSLAKALADAENSSGGQGAGGDGPTFGYQGPQSLSYGGKASTPGVIPASGGASGSGADFSGSADAAAGGGGGGGGGGGFGGGAAVSGGGGGSGGGMGGDDPFRSVGMEDFGAGGGGGMVFDKPVAFGTGTSGDASDSETGGDAGPDAESIPLARQLLPPGGELWTGILNRPRKSWLMEHVGQMSHRLCRSPHEFPSVVPICHRNQRATPSLTSALDAGSRANSVDAPRAAGPF
jgi:hypothetical protein